MTKWFDKLAHSQVSRRDFLKGSAAATAAVAGLSLAGCQSVVDTTTAGETDAPETTVSESVGMEHSPIVNPEKGGKWVAAACWHNCASRCMNKVMVKDGVVIRQKSDDTHEDSPEYPQQRSCAKGHSQQLQCFGADRLKYPMKRKNWEPLTGGKKELRGRDEWERITWEEAYDYIAKELKHCIDNYGNEAIWADASAWGGDRVINHLGGSVMSWDTGSFGACATNLTCMGLPFGNDCSNDRFDLENAEYIILNGANPAWSFQGPALNALMNAKQAGVKFVSIGPSYNATAQAFDAKWIPVHPGTDTALWIAVAHQMIQDDVVDYDFLNKYTVGFDADHMPADAKVNENYKDYLLGVYDGIAKDAAWGSKLCGASVEDIKYLAQILGKDHDTMMYHGYAPARVNGAENFTQAFVTVGFMGGHVGKPGNAVSAGADLASAFNKGATLVAAGGNGLPWSMNAVTESIPSVQLWDAILDGKYTYVGDPWMGTLGGGEERDIDIHLIACNIVSNKLQTNTNTMKGIAAFRKVDFVVARGMYMTTNCKYADIVLPITTHWERIGNFPGANNREWLPVYTQVVDPMFEAKSDQEIDCGILKALGYDPIEVYPLSEKAQFFNQIAGCTVLNEAGDAYETLVTITQEDIDAWGVKAELEAAGLTCAPQEGKITIEQLLNDGGYQVRRHKGDNYGFISYKDFVADPEANPLTSASGKLEIYCQAKADVINSLSFSDLKIKPYPNYFVPSTGYEHTFVEADITKEKGEYPYVVYNPHYLKRTHSNLDNNRWLQETFMDPVYISKADAKEKNVQTGDTVVIYNEYGRILRRVSVIPGMIPGSIGVPHGSNLNMDEENGVDRGGADNVLVGSPLYGMGVSAYNNQNCNFEKYDGEPLALAHEIPLIVFED